MEGRLVSTTAAAAIKLLAEGSKYLAVRASPLLARSFPVVGGLVNEISGSEPTKTPPFGISVSVRERPLVWVVLEKVTLTAPSPIRSRAPTCTVTRLGRV